MITHYLIKPQISFSHPQEHMTEMITCGLSHASVIYWGGIWHLSLKVLHEKSVAYAW